MIAQEILIVLLMNI